MLHCYSWESWKLERNSEVPTHYIPQYTVWYNVLVFIDRFSSKYNRLSTLYFGGAQVPPVHSLRCRHVVRKYSLGGPMLDGPLT